MRLISVTKPRYPFSRLYSKMSSHGDFKTVEASRPDFDKSKTFHLTKTVNPDWKPGSGATNDSWKEHKKISFDPFGEGRTGFDNYKMLIGAVTPRPIAFVSTVSTDGVQNLSPFSYFGLVQHDPPIFSINFSGTIENRKDSCKNLLETKECVVNIISEWFVEAANFTSTDAPRDVSEWDLTGLTPSPSEVVKAPHVAESAFSAECKVIDVHEWTSRMDPSKSTGTLFLVEAVKFHVREDVINKELNLIDFNKLKPVSRLGGITYARVTEGFELPRPDYKKEVEGDEEVQKLIKK